MAVPGSINELLLSAAGGTGYAIERSLRFNSSDSAFLSRTPASAGNRKKFTISFWIKRTALTGGTGPGDHSAIFSAGNWTSDSDFFNILFLGSGSGANINIGFYNFGMSTAATFRDLSAWYHFVCAVDTDQATLNNRIKFYQNGIDLNLAVSASLAQGLSTAVNNSVVHAIGKGSGDNFYYLNGYLADFLLIDGQQLDPSSFGEFDDNGIWQPIVYSGSFGTNGFHLDFADNSTTAALGTDTAGSNDWTVNNLSVTAGAGNDSLVDVPTNGAQTDTGVGGEVRGNYCTWNPLSPVNATYANGNLEVTPGSNGRANSTFSVSSGKWYYEATMTAQSSNPSYNLIGIGDINSTTEAGVAATSWVYRDDGKKENSNSAVSYGTTYTVGDVIGVAWDADTGTLTFYKNGVSQGSAYTNVTGTYGPIAGRNSNPTATFACNFGQRAFAYTAPSGFKALNTSSLPAPLVTKPSTVMDVKLYTGNGSTQTISGLNMSPDLVWIKNRSSGTWWHNLFDTVRGAGTRLASNDTAADFTDANSLSSFNSDGFSLGSAQTPNNSGDAYVAWTWDAGSSTVTNTQGSITSSVRTNNYLSVVTYTGTGANATVGHGLGVAPGLIILKDRTSAYNWQVYHSIFAGTSNSIVLNSTAAVDSGSSGVWNSTAPTSAVFSIGTSVGVNTNGNSYVAYCFAPVAGYANAFSYSGNGSSDGPMVWLGFRPRFIIQKRTDSAGSWLLIDTARDPVNVARNEMFANSSAAEYDNGSLIDVLSNGFKIRASFANMNASGGSFIGFAFAESPFQYARAR